MFRRIASSSGEAAGSAHSQGERSATWYVAALVVAVLVPALCVAALTLGMSDPLGGTKQIPAVIVNLDEGAEIDGEQSNVGDELCVRLVNWNSTAEEGSVSGFAWTFLKDRAAADRGLENGTYYVEVVIPEDFSEAVASTTGTDAYRAELQVFYNPALSYSAQVVGEGFIADVLRVLSSEIQEERLNSLFVTVQESGDDLLTLGNAGLDLTDGLDEAEAGSVQLASGADQLASGVSQLADGIGQLSAGIEGSTSSPETLALTQAMTEVGTALQAYAAELAKSDPDPALEQEYLDQAASAANKAAEANSTIGNPLVAYISGGTFQYSSGAITVTATETGLIPALAAYAQAQAEFEDFERSELEPLVGSLRLLAAEVEQLGETGEQTADDLEAYAAAIVAHAAARDAYKDAAVAYSDATDRYHAGEISYEELERYREELESAERVLDGSETVVEAAREAVAYDLYHEDGSGNTGGLIPELGQTGETLYDIVSRFSSLSEVEALVNKLFALVESEATAGAAAQGAAGKCEGYLVGVAVASSYSTSSLAELTSAISTIYAAVAGSSEGTTTLQSGTEQLAAGAAELASGLATAASTSDTLFTSLLDGQAELEEGLENADERAAVLTEPVTANGEDGSGVGVTTVATMGTSLAPYYLALMLWVGCLLAALILRPLGLERMQRRAAEGAGLRGVLEGFVPLALVAVLQALVTLAVLQFALNLNVNMPWAYYLLGLLTALAFAAAMQLLVGVFGFGGMMASVILLVGQVALSSAYFPAETVLPILGPVSMLLPMTHVVRGLRIAMCGLNGALLLPHMLALAGFAVLFVGITFVCVVFGGKFANFFTGTGPNGGAGSEGAESGSAAAGSAAGAAPAAPAAPASGAGAASASASEGAAAPVPSSAGARARTRRRPVRLRRRRGGDSL